MLEQERTALLCMAREADFVHAVGLEQRLRGAAVGIVAVDTGNAPFEKRHMRPAREFRALRFVALKTRLVDRRACLQAPQREIRHRIVTVCASEVVALMRGAGPEDTLSAAMAVEAHAVLIGDGLLAPARKPDNAQRLGRILNMDRARTVTRLATLHLELVARIEVKDFRMNRVRPVRVLLHVAHHAGLLTDISAGPLFLRRRRCLGNALQ